MTQQPSATSTPAVRKVALVSLVSDREFRKVRAHGQVIRHKYFQLRITDYRPRYGEVWQPRAIIGIVVPKKTLKHAVDRNRVRRRVHEALRTLPGLLPCRAIISPAAAVLTAPFAELQAALGKALGTFDPKKARPAGKAGGNSGRVGGVQNRVKPTPAPAPTPGDKP